MIDLDHKKGRSAALAALLVLGLALVVGPLASGMFTRAPRGATMLADFAPYMTQARLDGFSDHLRTIDDSVTELDGAGARRVSPTYAAFSTQWPAIDDDMSGLMGTVSDNLGSYRAMAGLPSFRLFPWFFAGPGLVIAVAAGWVLMRGRGAKGARAVIGVVGLGLVVAPFALGLFSAGPRGAQMMSAFRDLETTQNLTRVQGYFSQMAVGQGAIRLEVVPALGRAGVSSLPATTRLDRTWVGILNDMTPMIGAMSDNVGNYRAISGMPSFRIFPWAFLATGLIVLALAAVRPGTEVRR